MNYSPVKILAIDKEQLLLWALERACKGRALDITTAATVEQALTEINGGQFDLCLLDFDLKDQDRLELLKVIDECLPYVPVIITTASDTESCELNDAIRTTRRHGAWHLLEKPFSLDKLISFIDVIVRDEGTVKTCLNSLTHNYEQEKRRSQRRAHVQAVNYSYEAIVDGASMRVSDKGIVTDISNNGSCMLIQERLQSEQVISFEDELLLQCGRVSWCVRIAEETYRCGVQFC